MKIGCFACVEPFAPMPMARQFAAIRELGFTFADVTDNHDGAALGEESGFAPTVSLDAHPEKIRALAKGAGIRLSAFCKALKPGERLLLLREKLQAPIQWAEELGVKLLLETHGPVTDNLGLMGDLLESLGHEETVGVCLDTGNCWLGGGDPLAYVKAFGTRIGHVHWKDMPPAMEKQRGKVFGCGMALIALGDGVIGIEGIVKALTKAKINVATTLEIAGPEAVKESAKRLKAWASKAVGYGQ